MSSNSVFVILTDKVYQAVNFVQISIQIIESILEIGLKEKYFVTKGVVYRLKIAQVFQSLLCPSAFWQDIFIQRIDFLPLTSNGLLKRRLLLSRFVLLIVKLLSQSSYFLSWVSLFILQIGVALSNLLSKQWSFILKLLLSLFGFPFCNSSFFFKFKIKIICMLSLNHSFRLNVLHWLNFELGNLTF